MTKVINIGLENSSSELSIKELGNRCKLRTCVTLNEDGGSYQIVNTCSWGIKGRWEPQKSSFHKLASFLKVPK